MVWSSLRMTTPVFYGFGSTPVPINIPNPFGVNGGGVTKKKTLKFCLNGWDISITPKESDMNKVSIEIGDNNEFSIIIN